MKSTCKKLLVCIFVWTLVSCSADSFNESVAESNETDLSATEKTAIINEVNFVYNEAEVEILTLINNYRLSIGLNALKKIDYVSSISEKHNQYMITKKEISHDDFSVRAKTIISTIGAQMVGENLAYNYKTPKAALDAWLKSPDHKVNLDGDYSHCGIAVSIDSATGKTYYTNIFVKL